MKITKQQVLKMLKRVGPANLVDEVDQELPDILDLDDSKHVALLARYGLARHQLMERLGASP